MPIGSARERNITIEYGYSSCDNTEEEWEDEEEEFNVKRPGRQRNKKSAAEHYPRPHSHLFRTRSGKRARGNKHIRRWENSMFLSTLHQVTEEELAEDHSLILPPHTSAFKHLLTDTSQLMKWHTFAELPEEQQTKYMLPSHPHCDPLTKKSSSASGVKRIDRSIRSALTHNKRTPVEYIESLEEEALELFRDDHSSAVVFLQPSGFHRMMLHAVCQYLGLSSKTEMWDGKALMVVVECGSVFCPPDTALSSMLYQGISLMAL